MSPSIEPRMARAEWEYYYPNSVQSTGLRYLPCKPLIAANAIVGRINPYGPPLAIRLVANGVLHPACRFSAPPRRVECPPFLHWGVQSLRILEMACVRPSKCF